MSEQNIEATREGFRAWNAGDMDRLRELYHPDAIVRAPPGWPEPGPFVGRESAMQQYKELRGTFDRDSLALLSDVQAVADRVLFRVDWSGIGSGPQSDVEMTCLMTFRDGLIFEVEYFWDHDEALEIVGLKP